METSEFKWISQKMFTYQDPATSVYLNVHLESGIVGEDGRNNYCSPRVTVQLRDGRTQSNAKSQIELHFTELSTLIEKIDRLFSSKPIAEVFQSNSNIVITRYTYKCKKDLKVSFHLKTTNEPCVCIEILDPLSVGTSEKIVFLDYPTFVSLKFFCEQVRNNYAMISVSFMNACLQEKVLDAIKNIQLAKTAPIYQSVSKNEVDVQEEVVNPIEVEKDVQNVFNDFIDTNIDSIQLPMDGFVQAKTEEKQHAPQIMIEKTPMPFIGNFLNYDPQKLTEWVYAFICADEKSKSTTFCPLNTIFDAGVKNQPFNINSTGFYTVQYFLDVMLRRSITTYLKDGSCIQYPVFRMPATHQFKRGTECWDLAIEVLYAFIVYNNIYNCYIRFIDMDKQGTQESTNLCVIMIFLRSYLTYFPLSMDMSNVSDVKNDILSVLYKCDKNGFNDKLKEMYSKITHGGKLELTNRMLDTYIDNVLADFPKIPSFDQTGLLKQFQENQISNPGQITNMDEVKQLVMAMINSEKPKVSDGKLELFLSCIKKIDPNLVSCIEAKCSRYNDLIGIFREYNVSEEIIKIKRVMDRDNELKYKSDILKAAKELNEEISVTETRVMFEDNISKQVIDKPVFEETLTDLY